MQVRCYIAECQKIFEAPTMKYHKFLGLLRSMGWSQRGSVTGHIFYCDDHPPGHGGNKYAAPAAPPPQSYQKIVDS
jgi:hypothetical protein